MDYSLRANRKEIAANQAPDRNEQMMYAAKLRKRFVRSNRTFVDQVRRLFNVVEPILMVTDPPYGVDYDPKWRNSAGLSKTKRTGAVKNDDCIDWSDACLLFPGHIAYTWHAS